MNNKIAYISCPISLSPQTLYEVYEATRKQAEKVEFWVRDTPYSISHLNNADNFVLVLPAIRFDCRIDHLPPGCKRELHKARALQKNIFIAYKRKSDDSWCIYDAEESYDTFGNLCIKGITGDSCALSSVTNVYPDSMNKSRFVNDCADAYETILGKEMKDKIEMLEDTMIILGTGSSTTKTDRRLLLLA